MFWLIVALVGSVMAISGFVMILMSGNTALILLLLGLVAVLVAADRIYDEDYDEWDNDDPDTV